MAVDKTFDQTVYETAEITLNEVLGERMVRAFRFYVDLKSALKSPVGFLAVILHLIGPRQTEILREQIVSRLYKRYGLEYKPSGKKIGEELDYLKSRIKSQT